MRFGTFEFGRPTGYQGGQVVYADEKTETRLLMQNVQVGAVERDIRKGGPAARHYVSAEEAAERMADAFSEDPIPVERVLTLLGELRYLKRLKEEAGAAPPRVQNCPSSFETPARDDHS